MVQKGYGLVHSTVYRSLGNFAFHSEIPYLTLLWYK